jgi:hypothetical protein
LACALLSVDAMSTSPDVADPSGHMIEPQFADAFVRSAPWFFFFFFFSFLVAFAVLFVVAA